MDDWSKRWLRRADQTVVAGLMVGALVAMAGYWLAAGGHRGQLIEIDRAPPREARFQVDVNEAAWPELAQLPGIGETLGRRIVESREKDGPFGSVLELQRVSGIGPRTVERLRPYLLPLGEPEDLAGP